MDRRTLSRSLSGAVPAAVLAFVAAFGVATAGAASGVCTTAGVTTALAAKAFGPGTTAKDVNVTGEAANCGLYTQGSKVATANVFLYPKSDAAAQKALYDSNGKAPAVSGLGSGAIFVNLMQVGEVEFTAGAHYVEVDGPPSLLPKLKTLARAIYAKLG
jgi:hypothetical protein